MVKTCKFNNCKKQPSFNYADQKNGIYCSVHKDPNMIDVISKTCRFENCKTIPNYNFEGKKQAVYCVSHKENNISKLKILTNDLENVYIKFNNNIVNIDNLDWIIQIFNSYKSN